MTGGAPPWGDEPVALPIEPVLDLHSIPPRDVVDVVHAYLEEASARGLEEVRLIHGRGTGTVRAMVRRALAGCELVASFADATADRGGWGATVVQLVARSSGGPATGP